MNEPKQRTADYLGHIVEAIARIRRYTAGMNREQFDADVLVQDAVIRNIEIIGEAARNIAKRDPAFAAAHPEIPWVSAIKMRDRISHGYFSVDLETVWHTAQRDLPEIEVHVSALLEKFRQA